MTTSSTPQRRQQQPRRRPQDESTQRVWVRLDIVDRIVQEQFPDNCPPSDWKYPTATTTKKPNKRQALQQNDPFAWGWARAKVIPPSPTSSPSKSKTSTGTSTTTTTPRYASPVKSRTTPSTTTPTTPHRRTPSWKKKSSSSTAPLTIQIQDSEYAPSRLQHVTITLPSGHSPTDNGGAIVYMANSWWQQSQPPPHSTKNDEGSTRNSSHEPPHDLTSLTHLHEPAVVCCLKRRYEQDSIYTYTGKILLALNPFRSCDHLYGPDIMQHYWCGADTMERPPPHIYATAQDAYGTMMRAMQMTTSSKRNGNKKVPPLRLNQSILVSGESGAGKTVTTKIIMRYLATLSKSSGPTTTTTTTTKDDFSIEAQVLQSNPILESFGNARTIRNDNSSRFGKYIEIQFEQTGSLVCASIETYLLEKVRLLTQAPGERNYHIFYELLSSSSSRPRKDELTKLHIWGKTPQDFQMTNQSHTYDRRDGVTDKETFQDLRQALDTVGFTSQEQRELFTVSCALLHASNLTFCTTMTSSGDEVSELHKDNPSLAAAVDLWGVSNSQVLNDALCRCAIEAAGETLFKYMSIAQAEKALQALIKATYGALFTYIVNRVNHSILKRREQQLLDDEEEDDHSQGSGSTVMASTAACIGVLDIFGFESFKTNSFEQLCINYCNEALQQQFNKFVFKLEQEEYEREGIEWSFITFPDNQDVLDLIDKKHTGILSLLDEQCRVPRSSDQAYARATYEKCARHERFDASQSQKVSCTFTIYHYAGPVEYDTVNFIEKNKDELPKESTDLLLSSSHALLPVLGQLLRDPLSNHASSTLSSSSSTKPHRPRSLHRGTSSLMRESVGSQFCSQLRKLRDRIDETTPHYVRCLKPNDELVPDNFNPLIIADQLRCAGVLEAIRVSRVGFPQRYSHSDFIQRYRILAIREMERIGKHCRGWDLCEQLVKSLAAGVAHMIATTTADEKKQTNLQLESMTLSARQPYDPMAVGIQMGKTKVFLRRQAFDCLELLRNKKINDAAVILQKNSRRYLAVYVLELSKLAAVIIQSFVRQVNAKRYTQHIVSERSAVTVQCAWRQYKARLYLSSIVFATLWCQSHYRGAACRKMYAILFQERKARIIQSYTRRYVARKRYTATTDLTLKLQCLFRVQQAKRELALRKREARDFGAVAAERDRLRDEAARLRKQLEEAKRKQITSIPENASSDDVPSSEIFRLQQEIDRLRRSPPQSIIGEESTSEASTSHSELSEQYESLLRQKEQEIQLLKQEVASLQGNNSSVSSLSMNDHILRALPPPSEDLRQLPKSSASPSRPGLLKLFSPTRFLRKREIPEQEVTPHVSPAEQQTTRSPSSISLLDTEEDFFDDIISSVDASPSPMKTLQNDSGLSWRPTDQQKGQFLPNKRLVLHEAVSGGKREELETLLETVSHLHLKVNEGDLNGKTPLHLAALSSDLDIAELLLANDAIANSQDNEGNTPLHLASTGPLTALLLEKGQAKPNIPNLDGVCALHVAVGRKDAESVACILKHGACVNSADDINWFTPLHLVAQGGDCVDDTTTTPEGEHSPQKMTTGRKRIADLLCSATDPSIPDLNYQDVEGNTPLHHASVLQTADARDLFGLFLDRGADPNISNQRGQAPLHLLCHNEALRTQDVVPEVLDLMLYHGANPNLPTKTGCTPLHLSLYNQDVDSAVVLVNGGAELHNLWRKPPQWDVFWEDNGETDILALDMVQEEHSLHRILAAITKPQKKAPKRSWCMQCHSSHSGSSTPPKSSSSSTSMTTDPPMVHCEHCSRWVCGLCVQPNVQAEFFPKAFEMESSGCVCVVCEKILVSRREDDGNTQPTTSIDEDVSFQENDKPHRLIVGPESAF